MNIITKKVKLAPLAEPDDSEDLDEKAGFGITKKSISNDDMFSYLQNMLEKVAHIPANDLVEKLHEGWIRRQRITDDHIRTKIKKDSQWVKCWMVSHYIVKLLPLI
jgi:hypothetical protein